MSSVEELLDQARALIRDGKFQEARAALGDAIAKHPNHADLLLARADLLARTLGDHEAALGDYDKVVQLAPDEPSALNNRGASLRKLGRLQEAQASYVRALRVSPRTAQIHNNLANVFSDLGQFEDALVHYDRAIELSPAYADAIFHKANALHALNRLTAARTHYDRALTLAPGRSDIRRNRAIIRLLQGDLIGGLPEYEARNPPSRPGARWTQGMDPSGKTIFVHHEQGLGDTFHFIRYAKSLAARGARVLVTVHSSIGTYMKASCPELAIISDEQAPAAYDYQIPLVSLPLAFGTTSDSIDYPGPYLGAQPQRVAEWTAKLGGHGFKVGLCWQASDYGKQRSIPLQAFEGIGRIHGVRLISLQKGKGIEQLQQLPAGMVVETLEEPFDPPGFAFMDTAAVIQSCDLVLTCDTAVAHLAGAMGVPVWTCLPLVPDWRWRLGLADTPWYPSMRLFRQAQRGNWQTVLEEVRQAMILQLNGRADSNSA